MITSCLFCNAADNRWEPKLVLNGDFAAIVREAFIQKKDRKLRVRKEFEEFWQSNVKPHLSV